MVTLSVKSKISLIEKVSLEVKKFDICSLLKVLQTLGFQDKDILYRSNNDLSSRDSFCERIIFSEHFPKATIYVNLGFLSANSPLPTYFLRKMHENTIDAESFAHFLYFFDHHVIQMFVHMISPTHNGSFLSNWEKIKTDYLRLLSFGSMSTLMHLFQITFPELHVQVKKVAKFVKIGGVSTKLGQTILGENSYLQKEYEQTITSFKFTLTTNQTHTDMLEPLPTEIKKRLYEMIYPVIQKTYVHFRVILVIENNKSIAHLNTSMQLAYARIGWTDEDLRLLIFSGYSKNLEHFATS